MAFIDTIAPAEAQGAVRAMYERQQAKFGYVPNYARVFCYRPELMGLWAALLAGIRQPMDLRRFELVTFAAAQALRSSYCALAHGRALTRILSEAEVRALATEAGHSPLTDAEVAMMGFARQVARDATAVTTDDVAGLRAHGFSDAEVFDIAAVAAGRAFLAKLTDALGAEPDAAFLDMTPDLREALTIGRPIDRRPPECVAAS